MLGLDDVALEVTVIEEEGVAEPGTTTGLNSDAQRDVRDVLLVSEDLDELFELSDRILVMFEGDFVFETPIADADVNVIGRNMAGH